MKKEIVFHGTGASTIRKFNLNYLEGREHSLGIGIYFTRNKEILDFYSNYDEYKGFVYITEISYKEEEIRNYKDKLSEGELKKIIKKLNISVTKEEFDKSLNLEMIDIHFYLCKLFHNKRNKIIDSKTFLKKFTKATKIKVIKKTEPYGDIIRTDFCVMDNRILKIIKKVDLNIESI